MYYVHCTYIVGTMYVPDGVALWCRRPYTCHLYGLLELHHQLHTLYLQCTMYIVFMLYYFVNGIPTYKV